jgi:hypothetical protein
VNGRRETLRAEAPGGFELWHARTKNLHGSYRSEDDALADVWLALNEQGERYASGLMLGFEDARGETRRIAAGSELLDRARKLAATRAATIPPAGPRLEPV